MEPDFSSPEFHSAVQEDLERIVARYAMRILNWIVGAILGGSITFGGAVVWCTRVYVKIDRIEERQLTQEAATLARTAEWTAWRMAVDDHLRNIDGRTGDRWTRSFMREYNLQMGFLNPQVKTPDPDTIANRQTVP